MSLWQVVTGASLVIALACAAVAYRIVRARVRSARRRQALEINDNIVQGLTRVKWALEAQRHDDARAAADETLAEAQEMVTGLLRDDFALVRAD